MKRILILVGFLCFFKHIEGDPNTIEELIGSMKNSFSALSSKREMWFDNYSQLKKLSDGDKTRLTELLTVSKMAIPMIWQLYKNEVTTQKFYSEKLVKVETPQTSLPHHVNFPAPRPQKYHVEFTFKAEEEALFHLEIVQDEVRKLIQVKIDMKERRLVLTDQEEDGTETDLIILYGDGFPPITPQDPFRINIQVADDCIFTSIWVGDLSLNTPMPLPPKHRWCSKIYERVESIAINVISPSQTRPDSSEENEEEHKRKVQILSAVVYKGTLIQ